MSTMLYINENNKLKTKITELYNNYLINEIEIDYNFIFETINNNKLSIEELITENTILKNKIQEIMIDNKQLKEDNEQLKENNKKLNDRIDNLEIENKQLKEENKQLKEENKQLKEENKQLKEEIKELKEENKKLNNRIDCLENKNYIKKIIIACQDLNNKESLEKIFDIPYNQLMTKLRKNRNFDCHFIFNDDDSDIILCKKKVLYDILINLNDSQKQLLNKKMNLKLVDGIINFLSNQQYDNINNDDYQDNLEWFEE